MAKLLELIIYSEFHVGSSVLAPVPAELSSSSICCTPYTPHKSPPIVFWDGFGCLRCGLVILDKKDYSGSHFPEMSSCDCYNERMTPSSNNECEALLCVPAKDMPGETQENCAGLNTAVMCQL